MVWGPYWETGNGFLNDGLSIRIDIIAVLHKLGPAWSDKSQGISISRVKSDGAIENFAMMATSVCLVKPKWTGTKWSVGGHRVYWMGSNAVSETAVSITFQRSLRQPSGQEEPDIQTDRVHHWSSFLGENGTVPPTKLSYIWNLRPPDAPEWIQPQISNFSESLGFPWLIFRKISKQRLQRRKTGCTMAFASGNKLSRQ